ncbi:hypothetical protein, partial [Shewanella algae]|uniref:hypothetical protein n=1 Tax=Shewanella algae TaxID=38313 RepID=UPI001E3B0D54
VFYAFLLRRQEVITIFFRLSLKGLESLFSSTLSRLSRCRCAVSVGAHYREPNLLCKGDFCKTTPSEHYLATNRAKPTFEQHRYYPKVPFYLDE